MNTARWMCVGMSFGTALGGCALAGVHSTAGGILLIVSGILAFGAMILALFA